MKDASWIAELLAHGPIRASFVPPGPILELRELTRTHLGEHSVLYLAVGICQFPDLKTVPIRRGLHREHGCHGCEYRSADGES